MYCEVSLILAESRAFYQSVNNIKSISLDKVMNGNPEQDSSFFYTFCGISFACGNFTRSQLDCGLNT